MRQLEAEARARAAAEQMPPRVQVSLPPAPRSVPPSRTGWTAKEVGAYILAPVLAVAAAWAMRAPAPAPDAPTAAQLAAVAAQVAEARADAAAARLDCAVAREKAGEARSRAAVAESVADSAASPKRPAGQRR